ncbi:MAG: hypothetical protein PQJ59_10720 [Spirochaetales bacterium]|nr:hypothetical protein [Spirochaetales bacterium]
MLIIPIGIAASPPLLEDSTRRGYFFPFPLNLEQTDLSLTYRSDLSCLLVLEGLEDHMELILPPLDGESSLSESFSPSSLPDFPVSFISIQDWEGSQVSFSLSTSNSTQKNQEGDNHQTILSNEKELEDDYFLYLWDEGNNILIFDFKNYEVQDKYFKRLAFFMEKPGYRGTLMTDEEIEGLHGWNAHDYSAEGLVSFYNLAREEDFPLNREELDLRQILLNKGIILFDGKEYLTGEGAIVSITRETSPTLRQRFITHESLHGLFFTDEEFREEIRSYWMGLPENYREIWRFFMVNNAYDPSDEVLMYNEMLGYTLQLHRKEVAGYFQWRFNRIKTLKPENTEYIDRITPYLPEVMLMIYDQLEYLVSRRYPYSDGIFED